MVRTGVEPYAMRHNARQTESLTVDRQVVASVSMLGGSAAVSQLS
jgi:hypothetical protein